MTSNLFINMGRNLTNTKGLRRDLNPPQAVFALNECSSSPQPPILTRLYYEGHFISCEIIVLYIIKLRLYEDDKLFFSIFRPVNPNSLGGFSRRDTHVR